MKGWTGTTCQNPIPFRLTGNGPWTIVDTIVNGVDKYYSFIPTSSRPIQFGVVSGTATPNVDMYANALYVSLGEHGR